MDLRGNCSVNRRFVSLACCLIFVFLWIFSCRPDRRQDAWLPGLFEEGRKIFYQTITDEISHHPERYLLSSEEIKKIKDIGNNFPRLYGILINLYYQKEEPKFTTLLEYGGEQSKAYFQERFIDLVQFAAENFVECFFRPGPNSEYIRDLLPEFKGKDRVDLIIRSIGYFAKLDLPEVNKYTNPVSPEFDKQWGLDAGKFRAAHGVTKGKGVKIAVIDSGIDTSHPIFRTTEFGKHFSLVGRDGPPWATEAPLVDWGWHGTIVSSIIARYAPEAQITMYRKSDAETMNNAPYPLLLASFMAACIYKAVHDGNDVINISAGLGNDFNYLKEACEYAYNNNVIIVTGSPYYLGKYLGNNYSFPGSYETTLSVTGIAQLEEGKYGYWEIAAPEFTTTVGAPCAPFVAYPTYVEEKDEYAPGISCATPIAASAVALAISQYPRRGTEGPGEYFETIKKLLTDTANPEAVGFQGFSPECGYGLIDAEKLVKAAHFLQARGLEMTDKTETLDDLKRKRRNE